MVKILEKGPPRDQKDLKPPSGEKNCATTNCGYNQYMEYLASDWSILIIRTNLPTVSCTTLGTWKVDDANPPLRISWGKQLYRGRHFKF